VSGARKKCLACAGKGWRKLRLGECAAPEMEGHCLNCQGSGERKKPTQEAAS